MQIDIRPLGPELLGDYLDFFDNVAFADHQEWAWCYCTYYHLGKQDEDRIKAESEGKEKLLRDILRNAAISLIKKGELHGYLAYSGGQVIGWCNAADKKSYKKLREDKDIWEDGEDLPVKSITCFIVAPEDRRKGIASDLLERVTTDAAEEGYKVLEAYPATGELDCYLHYHGHPAMYINSGFTVYKELDGYSIYRKTV